MSVINDLLKVLPDKIFLQLQYYRHTGKRLNLKNPKTFNEKIQWLKLYNRKDEYTHMVDKYEAKRYVASVIGEEYIIPTLGIWESPDDIDFEQLPDQFVLKCTHNSGLGMYICKDKASIDIENVKSELKRGLKQNYYYTSREWPYKNVKPRIIAEQYMEDESGYELKDYKIFCFSGEPRLIEVDYNRFQGHKRNIYNLDWKLLDVEIEYPHDMNHIIEKPDNMDKMLELAKKLSNDIPFLRVDFYNVNGKIFFGELTFFHGAGYEKISPESFEETISTWLKVDIVKKKR